MDSLFTPEVIEAFLRLMETAADKGGTAVIIWLLIPVVAAIVTAGAWLAGIVYALKTIKAILSKMGESEVRRKEIEKQPIEWDLAGLCLGKGTKNRVEQMLLMFSRLDKYSGDTGKSNYFHSSDVEKLEAAYELYEAHLKEERK